jgi:hypothetical protein
MFKIPYGISYFPTMSTEGYYYVDRTRYIEQLEEAGEKYLFFLRPRRFGKSLFVSMLHHYYGQEHKGRFQEIFGKYYIGQHPTSRANTYLVLQMQFSAIDTSSPEATFRDFLLRVKNAALNLLSRYPAIFDDESGKGILACEAPHNVLETLFVKLYRDAPGQKVYVLIDEYDHFANELIAFSFERFMGTVGRNGFVRKFYEILKEGTHSGVVDRIFITGVSPITLDSLTSGFNIAKNFTTDPRFNEMMGFAKEEVETLLLSVGIAPAADSTLMKDLEQWYNGYLFHALGRCRIYNPDMILYFASQYLAMGGYPEDLLDENIASDYSKIRSMFRVKDKEQENLTVLTEILETGSVSATLVRKFSFEDEWTPRHFVSLLFYLGILTVETASSDDWVFKIPNFVIRRLYYQFLFAIVLADARLSAASVDIRQPLKALSQDNDIEPLLRLTENILSQLAREDRAHFSEQHVKTIFASLFYQVGYFNIFSELEVRKSPTDKGRLDLLLTRRPPFSPKYQFAFELKYLPKSQKSRLAAAKKEAVEQLEAYLAHDDGLQKLDSLKAYVVVFLAEKGTVVALR